MRRHGSIQHSLVEMARPAVTLEGERQYLIIEVTVLRGQVGQMQPTADKPTPDQKKSPSCTFSLRLLDCMSSLEVGLRSNDA